MIDLDAYLDRIAWHGSRAPTLETLRGLCAAHAAAIPFENLNPLLGLPVALDLDSVTRKLVRDGRGGYCFEHNLLLAAALRALGLTPTMLAARVLWNQPAGVVRPRTHMLLLVEIEARRYVVDVGFGGMTLTGALALAADVEQATAHEPFRLVGAEGEWCMQALVGGQWKALYRFDLQAQHVVDYEVSNYYLSTHPASQFVTGLMAARAAPDCRFALRNRSLVVHRPGGGTEQRSLRSAAEIREVLERDFLVRLPDHPELDRHLEALPADA